MSTTYSGCSAEVCVFDVLVPFFGDLAGEVAMSATCFPMNCDVAAEQARKVVVTARSRMGDGMTLEQAASAACADAAEEMEAAMRPTVHFPAYLLRLARRRMVVREGFVSTGAVA